MLSRSSPAQYTTILSFIGDMYKTHTRRMGKSGTKTFFSGCRARLQLARHVWTHYYLLFDKRNNLANGAPPPGQRKHTMGTCTTTRVLAGGQYHRLPPANNIHIYSGNILQHNTAGQHACIGVAN